MKNAVLSYGLGVDSTAILLRWIYEPETRPCPLDKITVISAMTGDEFDDTARDVTNHILPLMREHGIRYVQVARHGSKEAAGITILSDSRTPDKLYIEGDYKLSDELGASGVLPSFSGAHICSQKFKAFVVEKWLSDHYENSEFGHAFGYSADEPKRVVKSEEAFRVRNVAFGFSSDEMGRVERAQEYDTSQRRGFYPLVEWGWDRQKCIGYILEKTGILLNKSACVFCPFAHNKQNLVTLQARHVEHPAQTADALMLERMSLSLNPRGQLYRSETLIEMTTRAGNTEALSIFQKALADGSWAIYRVRRLYGAKAGTEADETPKKGTVQRAVETVSTYANEHDAIDGLLEKAGQSSLEVEVQHGITYAYAVRRGVGYPAREEYFVSAPERVNDKTRYGLDYFNRQWAPEQYEMEFTAA